MATQERKTFDHEVDEIFTLSTTARVEELLSIDEDRMTELDKSELLNYYSNLEGLLTDLTRDIIDETPLLEPRHDCIVGVCTHLYILYTSTCY